MKKLLVVDDSKAMRLIVIRTLRQAGLGDSEITEAANGVEALKAVETHGSFDLILSDWNMPEMTGIQFLEKLRASGYHGKFGFVTSESTEDMKGRAKDAGAQVFVTKPFTAESFQAAFSGLI